MKSCLRHCCISMAGLLVAALSVVAYLVLVELYSNVLKPYQVLIALCIFALLATAGLAIFLDNLPGLPQRKHEKDAPKVK